MKRKLNGWKRIGIVVSIVWILGAGIYTLDAVDESIAQHAASLAFTCEKDADDAQARSRWSDEQRTTWQAMCDKQRDEDLAAHIHDSPIAAISVALIPVPLGRGFAYLTLFVVAWIKRGFQEA